MKSFEGENGSLDQGVGSRGWRGVPGLEMATLLTEIDRQSQERAIFERKILMYVLALS